MSGDPILSPALERLEAQAGTVRAATARARAPKVTPSIAAPIRPGSIAPAGWWEVFATAAAWTEVWVSWVPVLSHAGIRAEIGVVTDAAADGDLRFRLTAPDGLDITTNVLTIPGGTSTTIGLDWLHGEEVWAHQDVRMALEAYVRAAGGGFGVFSPYAGAFIMQDGHACVRSPGLTL